MHRAEVGPLNRREGRKASPPRAPSDAATGSRGRRPAACWRSSSSGMSGLIARVDAAVVDRVLGLDARCARLTLAQNAITDVEAGCLRRLPALEVLDVSANALRGVAWVGDAPALVDLSVAGNAV